jgi:AcrR family transcriptional regulator
VGETGGRSQARGAEHRRRLLAAARQLISERGYERVTVREIAREAHTSVPTLYHLFDGKQALLFAAVEDHFGDLLAEWSSSPELGGVARVLSIVDELASEAARVETYSLALMRVFLAPAQTRELGTRVFARLSHQLHAALESMRERGELQDWAAPGRLAERIAIQCLVTTLEWARGELDVEGMRAAATYATCLTLLGAVRGDAAHEVELRARETQGRAALKTRAALPQPTAVSGPQAAG